MSGIPTGDVTVTSDANHVVIELCDEAYPDRVIRCRLTTQQARELSAVLALKAHLFDKSRGNE